MTDLDYMVRVDRTVITVTSLEDSDKDDLSFWLSKTSLERFIALEILRQQYYRYDPISTRLQRLVIVTQPFNANHPT